MASQLITLAERYVLETEIARGGMASVWRARDQVLARPVAVKVLHRHLSEDDGFIERFRREALAAARLAHPNIVAIYDTGSETSEDGMERHYIVMEYCDGGTLADINAGVGAVAAGRSVAIGRSICDALEFAHQQGVVHRDVKPANVLMTSDGTLKVADFGIAKAAFVSSDITTTGAILGTVTYLSPEQARGLEPDARSDLYALGVVLYEMVSGRPPFHEESQIATAMRHLRDVPPPPRSIRAGIPRALESVIMKALEKDPDDRFGSAREMGAALSASVGAESTSAFHPPPAEIAATSNSDSGTDMRWIIPVLAIAALVVALALALPNVLDTSSSNGEDARSGNGGPKQPGTGTEIAISASSDFDPYGSEGEHGEDTPLAHDGSPATAWQTQTYDGSFEALGKPGVGLLFDLGQPETVARINLSGSIGAYEVRFGDEPPTDENGLEVAAEGSELNGKTTVELEEETEARYWLVWITSLPGPTGTASVAEVVFLGP
jgi:eukaryotic-like serine/threonine-protein kinase